MDKENKSKKPYVVCVIGPAGSGKDTISELIEELSGDEIQKIVSYTTRSIREGEIDGRGHFFVDENKIKIAKQTAEVVAYTKYGGYEYWTQKSQFEPGSMYVYVIDEAGVRYLRTNFGDLFNILTLQVNCDENIRIQRGVSEDRTSRDKTRIPLTPQEIDFGISNNEGLEDIEKHLLLLIKYVKKQHGSTKN